MWITPVDESEVSWSTPTAALVVAAVGGVALALAAVAVPNDRPGQLLVGLAAVGLLAVAGLGFAQRPKLAILSGRRLRVKRIRGAVVYDHTEVRRARIVRYPRLGRRVPVLEIDVQSAADPEGRLLIFGRWDLGANPEDVFDAISVHGLAPSED